MRTGTPRTRRTTAACLLGALFGCGYRNNTPEPDGGLGGTLADALPTACGATTLANDDYGGCSPGGAVAPAADPASCTAGRSVNACGAWVEAPTLRLARAVDLHEYSESAPTPVNFDCLTMPPVAGPVHASTLSGYVQILFNNPPEGTVGVEVEAFRVDVNTGAILDQVGDPYVTTSDDATTTNDWLYTCTPVPCSFRHYQIANVPTETPLVIRTSDGTGSGTWGSIYDYAAYFSDSILCASAGGNAPAGAPCVSAAEPNWTTSYDVRAILASEVQPSLADVAGDPDLDSSEGELIGEVHDCGDIRISGATADTDTSHDGPVYYFSADEANPLPSACSDGTTVLGLFEALNLAAGNPIRVSAVGIHRGSYTLLGTAVVRTFAGPSVTSLILRGRRPYQ